jgi:glutamine cyclotransferase
VALATGVLIAALGGSAPVEPVTSPRPPEARTPEALRVQVVETLPHDRGAYTQGLLFHEGVLYESTGQYRKSALRRVDPASGEILAERELADDLFAEGLARVGDRLIQLTWKEQTALVWDLASLSQVSRFDYEGEGWGLCFDGRHLVMSDGSSVLTMRSPETFKVVRRVEVTLGDGTVGRLNELECVAGRVYANVYTTDWIVRVDPASGRVEALIDASDLLSAEERRGVDVLNGIAYDEAGDVFYLTGKLWPKLFAVRFVDVQGS